MTVRPEDVPRSVTPDGIDAWLARIGLSRGLRLGAWQLSGAEVVPGIDDHAVTVEFTRPVRSRVIRIQLRPTNLSRPAFARTASLDLAHESVPTELRSTAAKLTRVVHAIVNQRDGGHLALPLVAEPDSRAQATHPAVEGKAHVPAWRSFYADARENEPPFPTAFHRAHLERTIDLSEDLRAAFRRDGHVIVRGALDPGVVLAARVVVVEALSTALGGKSSQHELPIAERDDTYSGSATQVTHFGADDAAIRVLTQSRRLGKMAADLMGVQGVRTFCEDWFIKEPRADRTPWHQDAAGMSFDAAATITVWIPFQPVNEGTGLLRFARGSHRSGIYLVDAMQPNVSEKQLRTEPNGATTHRTPAHEAGRVGSEATIEERAIVFHFVPTRAESSGTSRKIGDVREEAFDEIIRAHGWAIDVSPPLDVGDVSFHDGSTIHAGLANDSDAPRIALALHCFADGAVLKEPVTPAMRNFRLMFAADLENGARAACSFWPLLYE